jgi:hypothetical protein
VRSSPVFVEDCCSDPYLIFYRDFCVSPSQLFGQFLQVMN